MSIDQKISSAATSVNTVPAVFSLMLKTFRRSNFFLAFANDILDYGGGRFDTLTNIFAARGIRNWVYDPYNRSKEHNKLVRQMLSVKLADHAICSNVLNVIREPIIRQGVLEDIRSLTKPGGFVFITVYEGDRSSRGRRTSKGWQANRPTKNYLREVKQVFPVATTLHNNKLILAEVPNEARGKGL